MWHLKEARATEIWLCMRSLLAGREAEEEEGKKKSVSPKKKVIMLTLVFVCVC